jgi:hypothetical protein
MPAPEAGSALLVKQYQYNLPPYGAPVEAINKR